MTLHQDQPDHSNNPFVASLRRVPVEETRSFMQPEGGAVDHDAQPYDFAYDMMSTGAGALNKPLKLTQGELDAMLAAAEAKGRDEGITEARTSHEAQYMDRMVAAIEQISDAMVQASDRAQATVDAQAADAAELGFVAARTLAAHLIARNPQAEIVGLLEDNIEQLRVMPHLVLRVEPELCETLQPMMEDVANKHGLKNPPMVMPDPDIAWGNARLDWGDGSIVRDHNETLQNLERSVRDYAREVSRKSRERGATLNYDGERPSLLDAREVAQGIAEEEGTAEEGAAPHTNNDDASDTSETADNGTMTHD